MVTVFRKRKSVLCISLLLGVIVTCTPRQESRLPAVVRVGVLQHGSAIPVILAQDNGYFAKRGVNVRLIPVTPDQQMPSLLRGDVDLISPSSFPVILSTFQQNPGKIQCFLVGGESKSGDTLYGIVVRPDSPYKTLSDLVGKTIGSASKFTSVNLRNVLRYKFGDEAQATTVRELGDRGLLIEGLQNGTLDAAVVDQPALSSKTIQSQFRVIERNFRAEYLFDPYWSGAGVANTDWVTTNRKTYEAFLDAIDDSLKESASHPIVAKEAFIRHFGVKDVEASSIGLYVYPNARFVPPESFRRALIKMLADNKLLSAEFDDRELFYRR